MKKFILSCLLSTLCLTVVFAVDYSGTCGNNILWSFDATTGILNIQGSGPMNSTEYNTWSVNQPWKDHLESIKKVVISEGITTVGYRLFADCINLQEVVLPSTLDTIGVSTFSKCESLENINLPEQLLYIGGSAFLWSGLKTITIPVLTKVSSGAFGGCEALETATVYGIRQYYTYLFSNCPNLHTLYWHVKNGGSDHSPIDQNPQISRIYFGDEVDTIPQKLCDACTNLRYVEIGKNVKHIKAYAFQNCPKLKKIRSYATTPPSIGLYGFFMTSNVDSVVVPCKSVEAYQNANFSYAYGWGNMNIVGDKDCQAPPTPEPENSTFWNISDAAFNSLGSITSKKTIDGLTIYATENKSVVIDADAREIDGLSFTHRLKFGGTGASDARTLSFKVDGNCDIDVYLMSASGSADRTLNVDKGSFGHSLATIPALGASISKGTVHYTGGATTIYLYSPSSGVNIYAIRVTAESTSQPTKYTVSVSSANSSMGTVSGGGTYEEGATATVTATPKSGYKFTKWSNGSTANPYTFTVTSDVSLTAYFEQASTPQPESSTFWNFSDAAFCSLGTITSTKTVQGLTLCATSDKNMVVDESTQEIDGISFTHRLKLNGTGDATYRSLKFNVTGDCIIDIYAKSGSSSADRLLNIDKGSFGNTYAQASAYGSAISKATVQYTGSATTICVYSSSSGINLYGIRVTYKNTEDIENTVVRTETQKILRYGQIYILRGEKVYTLQGQEVK